MCADSAFADFVSYEERTATVFVGGGSIFLQGCLFEDNYAAKGGLIHASTANGPRVELNEILFAGNEVDDGPSVTRAFDSAGIYATRVTRIRTIGQAGFELANRVTPEVQDNFLDGTNGWLPAHLDGVAVRQPPFWTPAGAASTEQTSADVAAAAPPRQFPWSVRSPPPLPLAPPPPPPPPPQPPAVPADTTANEAVATTPAAKVGADGGSGGPKAAVVIPIIVCALLVLAAAMAFIVWRRQRQQRESQSFAKV